MVKSFFNPEGMDLGAIFFLGMLRFYDRFDWENPSSASDRLTAIADILSFMIFLVFLLERSMPGMSLVDAITIIGLFLLRHRIQAQKYVKIISGCIL